MKCIFALPQTRKGPPPAPEPVLQEGPVGPSELDVEETIAPDAVSVLGLDTIVALDTGKKRPATAAFEIPGSEQESEDQPRKKPKKAKKAAQS